MPASKEIILDNKKLRRLKGSANINTTLNENDDIVISLPDNITVNADTATTSEKVKFTVSNEKAYLLGTTSTESGQKPVYNSAVYTKEGTLYAETFNGKTINTSAVSTLFRGFTIPDNSIPTARLELIIEKIGNYAIVVQETGTLSPGWYEAELAGGGGGNGLGSGNSNFSGGDGGYLLATFFVPYTVRYRIMAGGGGENAIYTQGSGTYRIGGGGGGGSVLDIPQLGICFIATGGGGGGGGGSSTGRSGGGGGGYGGGASGSLYLSITSAAWNTVKAGAGGAGGGANGGQANELSSQTTGTTDWICNPGGGAGGGKSPRIGQDSYTGGIGGNGSTNNASAGGNNLNSNFGGGAIAGFNGYARLYKLH